MCRTDTRTGAVVRNVSMDAFVCVITRDQGSRVFTTMATNGNA